LRLREQIQNAEEKVLAVRRFHAADWEILGCNANAPPVADTVMPQQVDSYLALHKALRWGIRLRELLNAPR